jgi:hypothetical protein
VTGVAAGAIPRWPVTNTLGQHVDVTDLRPAAAGLAAVVALLLLLNWRFRRLARGRTGGPPWTPGC